jgi:ribonuclease-3
VTPEEREQRVAELEARLGVALPDRGAALEALTHTSYVNENPGEGARDNERLEYLGDAVLDLAVSDLLMRRLPDAREGELSRLRAAVVREEVLAEAARTVGLGALLLLGRGEERTGGRDKASLLADAFEAVLGALYVGAGYGAALATVERLLGAAIQGAAAGALGDYKTRLQELAQARWRATPAYRVAAEKGPEHDKTFEVEVAVQGTLRGRGRGRSKKEAEQAAAREALEALAREQTLA